MPRSRGAGAFKGTAFALKSSGLLGPARRRSRCVSPGSMTMLKSSGNPVRLSTSCTSMIRRTGRSNTWTCRQLRLTAQYSNKPRGATTHTKMIAVISRAMGRTWTNICHIDCPTCSIGSIPSPFLGGRNTEPNEPIRENRGCQLHRNNGRVWPYGYVFQAQTV